MFNSGKDRSLPRVLIIEDDSVTRRVLAKALRRDGHVVEVVGELDEAVPAATAFDPDLIIADWLFPEGVSLDVARCLRRLYPTIPMVFVSGLPVQTFECDVRPLTPLVILEKPFSLHDLRDLIRQALAIP